MRARPLMTLALTLLLACTSQAEEPIAPAEAARQAVERAIGQPACSSNAQCRSLAMGHRPCGGAEFYLAYSTQVSASEKLERLAEKHRAARKAAHQASGRMSTCQVLPDPGAHCVASTKLCALGTPVD